MWCTKAKFYQDPSKLVRIIQKKTYFSHGAIINLLKSYF